MKKKLTLILLLLLLILSLLLSSCNPLSPVIKDILIISSAVDKDYVDNGKIHISLIPMDITDNPVLNSNIKIEGSYVISEDESKTLSGELIEIYDFMNVTLPWAFIIDIDSSGSMSGNDPKRMRVDAAKTFVDSILEIDSESIIAIGDFGAGNSDGFTNTRLLQDFTSDKTKLYDAIEKVYDSDNTPLYESVYELLNYFNSEIDKNKYKRSMLVLSDGEPNSYDLENSVYEKAREYDITINTTILGSNSSKVLQELAFNTYGGVFTTAMNDYDLKEAFNKISLVTENGYMYYVLKFSSSYNFPKGSFELKVKVLGGTTKDIMIYP